MTGENIASGQLWPEEAIAGWIKGPGHCANMRNGAYTEMGASFLVNATSRMGGYWVHLFGAPRAWRDHTYSVFPGCSVR